MTTLLAAENLQRHYRVGGGPFRTAGVLRAVDGVSFALGPRRTLAVVGESGSGKSTLGRMVSMIEAPTEGRLTIGGREVTSLDRAERKALRRAVQVVFQDPFGSLNPRKKIGDILGEPLVVNTSLRAAEREEKCRALLAKVGLRPEHYARYPHMFSGGQRQRVAIARALMLEPDIVVADEAVSALDVSIQAQVLNLMMDAQ